MEFGIAHCTLMCDDVMIDLSCQHVVHGLQCLPQEFLFPFLQVTKVGLFDVLHQVGDHVTTVLSAEKVEQSLHVASSVLSATKTIKTQELQKKYVDTTTNMTRRAILISVLLSSMVVTMISFLVILFAYDVPSKPYGEVRATENISNYGFGDDRTLVVLNLTAYASSDTSDVDERGLNGAHDIHPTHKRYAQMTMYKNGAVFNDVLHHPVAIDQKGGYRPQIYLGIEFRDPEDITEDYKAELLGSLDTDLEDYFIRGCYFDTSCTRDFTPTVMDVTPQKKGELVEVLFWQEGIGYTYEGVYGLFAKMKRKYYEKSVPWDSKGNVDKDEPCSDELLDIAVVFESEMERPDRGSYNTFEKMVEADMVYPSSSRESYINAWKENCTEKYDRLVDYYTLPNLLNKSVVPLNITTFVQMYMAAQLMRQVDFGFRGAQQYYYKGPDSMVLMTGPPYDFDSAWDVCGIDKDTVDIITCHGETPSPLWAHMGHHALFVHAWKTEGIEILDRNMIAVRKLYRERRDMYDNGYFARHQERWTMTGRIEGDLSRHLIALARESVGPSRDTIGKELDFQLEWYEERYIHLRRSILDSNGFDVHVSWAPYVFAFLRTFWWVFAFVGAPLLILCGMGVVHMIKRNRRPVPSATVADTRSATSVPMQEMAAKRRRERL